MKLILNYYVLFNYFDGKSSINIFAVYTFYLTPEYFFRPQVSLKSVQVFFYNQKTAMMRSSLSLLPPINLNLIFDILLWNFF